MNFVKFIDNRFQECRLTQSTDEMRKEYTVAVDAEAQALSTVLNGYRSLIKWLMVPKVLVHFILVKAGILGAPRPVLIDKLEADKLKELRDKSKKLGMLKKVENEAESNASDGTQPA
jgi:hypothetical protein